MASARTDKTQPGPNRRHIRRLRDEVAPYGTVEQFRDGTGGFFYARLASVPRDIDPKLTQATINALEAMGIELRGYVDTGRILYVPCDKSCYSSD